MAPRKPTSEVSARRRYPVGVEVFHSGNGSVRCHARVWAPAANLVELVLEDTGRAIALTAEGDGYHSSAVEIEPGTAYRYRLNAGESFPDPASRYQPDGPHGPSVVIDARAFHWTDDSWEGVPNQGQVIYELHVGTFTEAGTYRAAIERLPDLV